MTTDGSSSGEDQGRILRFRHRRSSELPDGEAVEGLGKYERSHEQDDYRHRMLVNAAALVFIAFLIGAGYWLATSMAQMRKNQDCVLSGRRNCAPVEVNRDRW